MFDTQKTGSVDIHQFAKLFEYINQWLNIFKTYDRNGSGQIDDGELNQGNTVAIYSTNVHDKHIQFVEQLKTIFLFKFPAFTQMGFNFSPNFTQQLATRSSDRKEVSVDEFIVLCVSIQRLTEAFRVRDTQQNGYITIGFEDFLSVVLTNTN